MNAEVKKAMEKKTTFNFYKWWRENGYKVLRVVLFPVWMGYVLKEKYVAKQDSKEVWDEARANEILNYYIPRASEWNENTKEFYFFDNGIGWGLYHAKCYLKRKDRKFWKVNSGSFGWKMRDYLIEKFELEGFTKELGNCSEGFTEVIFTLKEKEKEQESNGR